MRVTGAGPVRSRPRPRPALLVLVLVAALTGCAQRAEPAPAEPGEVTTEATVAPPSPPATTGDDPAISTLPLKSYVRLRPSPPARLEIPRIGVRTDVITLGLAADGTMEVPDGGDYDRAGWYTEGPQPGQLGPAVIAGHVDSRTGPSVFYRLRELRAGDLVTVRRADDRVLRFRVEGIRQYPKSALPADDVFGPVPWPALRLITCGGTFDREAGSYRDNLVVSTRLEGA